jgi:hypothetical protein
MTIHIGKRFVVAVIGLLLVVAAGAVGYKLGADSRDGDVKAAEAQAKSAAASAFERGRAQGIKKVGRRSSTRITRRNRRTRTSSSTWDTTAPTGRRTTGTSSA